MKTDDEEFLVKIQLINRKLAFDKKPEDILADDEMVDQFSPRDIRTLTYLGYLGINEPKYKILAQRLSEENNQPIFALKKKGNKNIFIKTASEIANEHEILENLASKDAHIIGYTVANDSFNSEKEFSPKNQ